MTVRRERPVTLADIDQALAENLELGYVERAGTDEHGRIRYRLTDAGRRHAEELMYDDDELFVCPVCKGTRTVQPDRASPPEECPRCVDPDEGA